MKALSLFGLFASVVCTVAYAAPVPPAPTQLTPTLLQGRWEYDWGRTTDGWIEFHPDSMYASQHHPGSAAYYCGYWYVTDRNEVVLIEGEFQRKYTIAVKEMRGSQEVRGVLESHGTVVRFRNRKRWEE